MPLKLSPYVREYLALNPYKQAEYEAFIDEYRPGIGPSLAKRLGRPKVETFRQVRHHVVKARGIDQRIPIEDGAADDERGRLNSARKRLADLSPASDIDADEAIGQMSAASDRLGELEEEHAKSVAEVRLESTIDDLIYSWPSGREFARGQAAVRGFIATYEAMDLYEDQDAEEIDPLVESLNASLRELQPWLEVLPDGTFTYRLRIRPDLLLKGGAFGARALLEIIEANATDPTATGIARASTKADAHRMANEIYDAAKCRLDEAIGRDIAAGRNVPEIAKRFGMPEQTVRDREKRGPPKRF